MFLLHHSIQQPTLIHAASQVSSKQEKFPPLYVSKQSWKGGLLRIHKLIFTDSKTKAELLGQGHVVSHCSRQTEMSALLAPRAML